MRLIDADKLIHTIRNDIPIKKFGTMKNMGNFVEIIENAPTVSSAVEWHKVVIKYLTEEEAEYFDCEMPEDGEEILVATKYGTGFDVCRRDYDGIWLERCGDWDGVFAWAKMPEYKDGAE